MAINDSEIMNDEQRALVEDNYNLVHFVLQRLNIDKDRYDDYEQVAALALCKAALRFDESKGYKFTTYAVNSIRYRLLTYFRTYEISMIKLPLKIYQETIKGEKQNIKISSYDSFSENPEINWEPTYDGNQVTKNEDNILDDIYIEEVLSTLNKEEEEMFGFLLQGYNQSDIAKIYDCSRASINIKIQGIRQKLKGILERAEKLDSEIDLEDEEVNAEI